jgi:ADP-ribosylglycohydrolase
MDLFDKILGGLYGQALGDAWAMPALLSPKATWEWYGGWITKFLPAPDAHPVHYGMKAGKVTDDTEQAFALAEAFIADGKVTQEGTARAVMGWYERIGGDTSPYVGPSTRRAVLAIKRGLPLEQTGERGDTNGASMRISPVGLIHPGDLEGAVRDAYLTCVPTHNTDVAVSGAAAVAGAIAMAMPDGATLEDIIAAGQRAASMGRECGGQWMGASVARRIDMAVEIARSHQSERARLQEIYDVIGCTLAISESVPAAFGVLVMANGEPQRAAIYAAALSGDADTIAAMACAIAGAWVGFKAFDPYIPQTLSRANPEFDFEGVARGLMGLVKK